MNQNDFAPCSQVHPDSALPSIPTSRTLAIALEAAYPYPGETPHTSVKMRYTEQSIAFHTGWNAALAASWMPASTPPDADTTVMLALADGEVWQGYFDGTDWIEVSGLRLAPGRVTYWQHTPKHPEDRA